MKRVVSPAPMLNDCQLMTAFWLDCVTVTVEVPVPAIAAEPPTTCPPSGLASAEPRPSGTRADVARRSFRTARPLKTQSRDEEVAPVIAGTLCRFRRRYIDVEIVQPPQPD